MRNFIVVGHRAVTSPTISLNDLPGTGGRMDIITRCVNTAFCISHNTRKDVEIAIVLLGPETPPKTVRFIGSELKYLNPDERSTGALIRNALIKYETFENDKKNAEVDQLPTINSSPGVYISNEGFEDMIQSYIKTSKLAYLNESGSEISKFNFDGDLTFILSDHIDFTPEEENLIRAKPVSEISLGPTSLHSDQCITIIHNYLDKMNL